MSRAASSCGPGADRDEQVRPPQADHVPEGPAGEAVPRGVSRRYPVPAPVLEGQARALALRLETDLHLRALAGREVPAAELEHEPGAGLPDEHAADLEARPGLRVVDLHQSSADAGLETHRAALLRVEPVAGPALPPLADLAREHVECPDGIHRDQGGDGGDLGRPHERFPRRVRSAWALKAPS